MPPLMLTTALFLPFVIGLIWAAGTGTPFLFDSLVYEVNTGGFCLAILLTVHLMHLVREISRKTWRRVLSHLAASGVATCTGLALLSSLEVFSTNYYISLMLNRSGNIGGQDWIPTEKHCVPLHQRCEVVIVRDGVRVRLVARLDGRGGVRSVTSSPK